MPSTNGERVIKGLVVKRNYKPFKLMLMQAHIIIIKLTQSETHTQTHTHTPEEIVSFKWRALKIFSQAIGLTLFL